MKLLAFVLLAALVACTNSQDADTRACRGIVCSAGQCISNGGQPECVCGAWEEAGGDSHCVVTFASTYDGSDTAQQAVPLVPGQILDSSIDARLSNEPDVDFFRFDAQEGHRYSVVLDATQVSGAIRLELLDGNQQELPSTDSAEGAAWPESVSLPLDAGVYYVKITGPAGPGGPYRVQLNDLPQDENAPGTPQTLSDGQTVTASFQTPEDVDSYVVTTFPGEYLRATCDQFSGACTAEAQAETGTVAKMSDAIGTVWKVLTGGSVRFDLTPGSVAPYQFTVKVLGFDDYPDTPSLAHPLTIGVPLLGTIEASGDQDWFSFPMQTNEVYETNLSGAVHLEFDSVDRISSGNMFEALHTGTGYLAVSGLGLYSLELRDVGPDATGGGSGAPIPIPLSTDVEGALFWPGAVARYSFPTTANHKYAANCPAFSSADTSATCVLTLQSPDGESIIDSAGTLVFEAAADAGTGYLSVGTSGQQPATYRIFVRDVSPYTATPIDGGVNGALVHTGEIDQYALAALPNQAFSANCSSGITATDPLYGFDVCSEDYFQQSDPDGGPIYLRVAGAVGAYQLQLTAIGVDDHPEHGEQITVGQVVQGKISFPQDSDFFTLTPPPGSYHLVQSGGIGSVNCYVFDQSDGQMVAATLTGYGLNFTADGGSFGINVLGADQVGYQFEIESN